MSSRPTGHTNDDPGSRHHRRGHHRHRHRHRTTRRSLAPMVLHVVTQEVAMIVYPRPVLLGTRHTHAIELSPGLFRIMAKRSALTGGFRRRG